MSGAPIAPQQALALIKVLINYRAPTKVRKAMAEKVQHTIRAVVVELDEAVNFGDLPNAIQVIRHLNQCLSETAHVLPVCLSV